jgi:hypothetical protein
VTLPVRGPNSSTVIRIDGRYETGATTTSAVGDRIRFRHVPGKLELTGLDAESTGGRTTVSGSVSNVGLSAVRSVVVGVVPADGVAPVAPNRRYFVGTVPASDFVSFDVTARLDDNTSRVPLNVTYLTDGRPRSVRFDVPVEDESSGRAGTGDQGGGLLPAVGGVVVALLVGVVVLVGVLNSRGRE